MAFNKVNLADIELNAGSVHRSFLNMVLGEGDSNGNTFGVRVLMDGEPVALAGASCIGYMIRSDGITLIIGGTVSGNTAQVTLPQAAYAQPGQFTLAIRVSGGGVTDTMRIVDGTVVDTTTGTVTDPTGTVPSLDALMAVIGQAEAAADRVDDISITATLITGTRYAISITEGT